MRIRRQQLTHVIDFSDDEWEEIVALSFAPFEFEAGKALTGSQWVAICEMALGKAQRVDDGDYGTTGLDAVEWSSQLRGIAAKIERVIKEGPHAGTRRPAEAGDA